MSEAFQRNGVAIVDELLRGVVQGNDFNHEVLQVHTLNDEQRDEMRWNEIEVMPGRGGEQSGNRLSVRLPNNLSRASDFCRSELVRERFTRYAALIVSPTSWLLQGYSLM